MALLPGSRAQHRYQLCDDDNCELFPCRVYKEGHRNGREDGHAKGLAEGYAKGFAEGIAACPARTAGSERP